jgi:acetyltransferase-like isoleucine patch superfamily enzyme
MKLYRLGSILQSTYHKYLAPPHSPEPFYTAQNPRYAGYEIGEWTYGKPRVLFEEHGGKLRIGKYCSIADDVTILLGGEHHLDWVTTYPFSMLWDDAKHFPGYPMNTGDVTIGHDVWVGHDAFILSGITIGNGAVIAARSLVTRDIPPYAVVAGTPARHIKQRFPDEVVTALQRIAWWNWPVSDVKRAWPLLLSDDIEGFVKTYGDADKSDESEREAPAGEHSRA